MADSGRIATEEAVDFEIDEIQSSCCDERWAGIRITSTTRRRMLYSRLEKGSCGVGNDERRNTYTYPGDDADNFWKALSYRLPRSTGEPGASRGAGGQIDRDLQIRMLDGVIEARERREPTRTRFEGPRSQLL